MIIWLKLRFLQKSVKDFVNMTQEKHVSSKLSLNIRKMKFMQRGLSEAERSKLQENEQIVTAEHWQIDLPPLGEEKNNFAMLEGFLHCQPCLYGRLSFGGFNKQIEKLMAEINKEKKEEYVEEADISDNEMTDHYLSLSGTLAKRFENFNKSRKRSHVNDNDLQTSTKLKRFNYKLDKRGFIKPK